MATLKDLLKKIPTYFAEVSRKPYEAVYGGKPTIPKPLPFKQQARMGAVPPPPVSIPYTKPVGPVEAFKRIGRKPEVSRFKLEAPEMETIRQKLRFAKPLAPEEKKIALREFRLMAGDIALTGITKPAREELFDFIKKARPLERKQAALYTKARAGKIAKAKAVKITGLKGFLEKKAKLGGEMPKLPQFEPPDFPPRVVDDLFNSVAASKQLDEFGKISAGKGLENILSGQVPVKSRIIQLEKVFGPEFATSLTKLQTKWQKAAQFAKELVGVPRSLMAGGFDMSYGLRQGIYGGYRHPKQWGASFKRQIGWFLKDKNLAKSLGEIKSRETYPLMRRARIDITDLGSRREEQFISSLAEKIPGIGKFVRASGRAWTGFASRYRADIFDYYIKNRMAQKLPVDDYYLTHLGNWINSMTGRGHLGRLEPVAQEVATALFSPRYFKSIVDRFNPAYYAKLHPSVRKEAVKTLAAFVGGTFTTLMLADQMPGVSVNWRDPTSADFLKVKIGDTRVDIMAGMQQPMVLLARIFSNKLTSTTTGKTIRFGEGYKPLTRWDMVQGFFENKTAPVVSFLIGAMRGTTPIGKPFEAHKEAAKRMTPIFLQDMIALSKENQIELTPVAGPLAFFGAGVQTYPMKKGAAAAPMIKIKEEKPSFLERLLTPEENVKAAEGIPLPTEFEDRLTLYKDTLSEVRNYRARKVRIQHEEYGTEEDRQDAIAKLQGGLDSALKMRKRIEKEHPEDVFQYGLDVYKSGGGMRVTERVKWASEELSKVKGEKFDDMVVSMLEAEVLTKSVAKELLEAGIDVGYYTEGGKIKPLPGSKKSGMAKAKKPKKVTLKVAKMKAVKAAPIRKGAIPKIKLAAPPKVKLYVSKPVKITTSVQGIPTIKLKPVSYKIKIAKG